SWGVTSERAGARTVTFRAGRHRVADNSSGACSHSSGSPRELGCSRARVSTTKEKYLPWVPPPPLASFSTLPARQRSIGPDFSLRPPQPPTPIIWLYASQLGKELSAAWTHTKPPPLWT